MTFKEPSGKFLADLIEGCKKGLHVCLYNMAPAAMSIYPLLIIMEKLGITSFLVNVLGPVMAIFGLPGQAALIITSAWINGTAGMVLVLSYFTEGVLDGYQVAIIWPMIYVIQSQFDTMSRIFPVTGIKKKYYLPGFAIAFIVFFVVGIFGNLLVHLFW